MLLRAYGATNLHTAQIMDSGAVACVVVAFLFGLMRSLAFSLWCAFAQVRVLAFACVFFPGSGYLLFIYLDWAQMQKNPGATCA